MRTGFQKIQRSLLNTNKNHWLFEHVAKAICEQVEDTPHVANFEQLADIPVPAQTIYWLWRFLCEAGINGMDVFVLNSLGVYSPQIHAALKEVRATELVRLLEAAIALARSGPAEFARSPNLRWFNQFPVAREFPELHLINKPAFALTDALSDVAASYIRANEKVLFQDRSSQ